MASYTVASGEIGAYAKTATADTVDTVTFAYFTDQVEVYGNGTDALYFTTDGTVPTVGGAATYFLPSGMSAFRVAKARKQSDGSTVVKVISHGATLYSVAQAT